MWKQRISEVSNEKKRLQVKWFLLEPQKALYLIKKKENWNCFIKELLFIPVHLICVIHFILRIIFSVTRRTDWGNPWIYPEWTPLWVDFTSVELPARCQLLSDLPPSYHLDIRIFSQIFYFHKDFFHKNPYHNIKILTIKLNPYPKILETP